MLGLCGIRRLCPSIYGQVCSRLMMIMFELCFWLIICDDGDIATFYIQYLAMLRVLPDYLFTLCKFKKNKNEKMDQMKYKWSTLLFTCKVFCFS